MPAAQIPQLDQQFTDQELSRLGLPELVAAARRRDPRAWDELLRRYGNLVRAVVRRHRLQDADAADAVQSTWCKAVEQLAALRDPERMGAWLSTIARHECLALIRRARRELPDAEAVDARLAPTGGPEPVVLAAEAAAAVTAAVARLEPRRRQLVHELFYLPARDYERISRTMGMPVGSIGPTRARALAGLRVSLERAGFDFGGEVGTRLSA